MKHAPRSHYEMLRKYYIYEDTSCQVFNVKKVTIFAISKEK